MFDWVLNTPLSSFYKITLKVSESKEKGSNDNMDEGTSNVIQIKCSLMEISCKSLDAKRFFKYWSKLLTSY